jgi:Leucine Rich repeat
MESIMHMSRAGEHVSGWGRSGKQWAGMALLLCGLAAGISCGSFPASVADARVFPFGSSGVQEGEVTLRDGEETSIRYAKAYQGPPRLIVVEFRQSWFKDKPFAKSDFQFLEQKATGFRIVNNHPEPGSGSAATIKWRAEGVLAAEQPAPPPLLSAKATQEQVAAAIKSLGGTVTLGQGSPIRPVIAVDLHNQRVTDAHLTQLGALPDLHSLNLSGTHVTDEGMKTIASLNKLQILQLNETAISDAGLAQLEGLKQLRELGLYRTRVTDDGLPHLKSLTNLHDLTLSGSKITERGMAELKGLHDLRHLILSQTGVSKAGVQELKKAMPKTEIIQ